jgi:hypothetical protein
MRRFHRLALDSKRRDLQTVVEYDLGDLFLPSMWEGTQLSIDRLQSVKLWIGDGKPADYLGNPLSLSICSTKLVSILSIHGADDFQVLPVPMFSQRTGDPVGDYCVINVTRMVDCLVREEANLTYMTIQGKQVPCVNTFVLRESCISPSIHMFRIPETKSRVLLSDDVAQDMIGKGLKGLVLIHTQTE